MIGDAQKTGIGIDFSCRRINSSNFSEIITAISQPTFIKIENLKKKYDLSRIPGEGYQVIVSIKNPFSYDITEIFIRMSVKIKVSEQKSEEVFVEEQNLTVNSNQVLHFGIFDISGLLKSTIKLENIWYKINSILATDYNTNSPFLIDMTELRNENCGFKSQSEMHTAFLLLNYTEHSLPARGWLLKFMFKSLEEVLKERKFEFEGITYHFGESDLDLIQCFIQADIISRIMMYIEDLAAILESNRVSSGDFYRLLDNKEPDLGKRITGFFENMDNFTTEEYRRILSYLDPSELKIESSRRAIVNRLIELNIMRFKESLSFIRDFRNSHLQLFRRYKHGGLAVKPGYKPTTVYPFTSRRFDLYSLVFTADNPFIDIIPIPFSKDVIDSYRILLPALQYLVYDVIENKMECIYRGTDGVVPYHNYSPPNTFTPGENQEIMYALSDFHYLNPYRARLPFVDLLIRPKRNQVQWYVDLENNMKKWKEMGRAEQENKRLT